MAQTNLDIVYSGIVANRPVNGYSGSWKCIGNDVHGAALPRVCDDQGSYAHWRQKSVMGSSGGRNGAPRGGGSAARAERKQANAIIHRFWSLR